MRFIKILAFAAMFLLATSVFAQEQKPRSDKELVTLHYYSFQGQASPQQLEFLQQELSNMEFVTEVKVEYKAEKSAGQVRLITREKAIVSEGDKQFNPVNIKRTFINKGFNPVEYHREAISNNP